MHALNSDPLWDEGIASFLKGEYTNKGSALGSSDLQRLANENAVRVGDLLETLFLMAIYGAWYYTNETGLVQELNEDALDELYAKGRVGPEDLAEFDGVWVPAP